MTSDTSERRTPPLVTVVLLTTEKSSKVEIERSLRTLAGQSPSIEVELLCDAALVPEYLGQTDLARIVPTTRSATARPNLTNCRGEWVALLVAGDQWPTDRLATALRYGVDNDVLYGDVFLARDGRSTGRRVGEFVEVPAPTELLGGLLDQHCIPRSSTIIRRTAWDAIEPSAGADVAWDLDLWLQLLSIGLRFHRLEEALPVVEYPASWSQADRLSFLTGALAAYRAAATRDVGPSSEAAQRRRAEGLAELLIFSRYQRMSRRDRLSVLGLPEARRSARTVGAQLAAGLLPGAYRHYQPELANFRPRTTTFDVLADRPLHDCSRRPDSLCNRAPLVTIAIACYNYGRYLPTSVNSALRQSYPNVEVVVIDDGSIDDTPDVVASFGGAIRSIRQDNAGPAAAYNLAARVAAGEYLTHLDADDELHPLYVQELLGAFCDRQQDASLGFVYSQMRMFERERQITWYPDFDSGTIGNRNYVNSSALMRCAALRDAHFDPELDGLEDWDFFLGLVDQGWTGQLVDLPLLRYRTHNDGKSRSDTMRKRQRARALRATIGEKHDRLRPEPILRRGRLYENSVRS